jgi:hypothetical protein
MGPMVRRLESRFHDRVRFRRIWVDQLVVGTEELRFVQALTPKVQFERTPTFLLVGQDGRLRQRHVGVTGYLTLEGELQALLAPALPDRPSSGVP